MGADVKAIRGRIRSVESTMHITKAMQLVASSKLRRATERMEKSRFFFETMEAALTGFGRALDGSVYGEIREEGEKLLVVIAGDRGLAGGYNANLFRAALSEAGGEPYTVLPIGRKALEYFRRRGVPILGDGYPSLEDFSMQSCAEVGKRIALEFREGRFRSVTLVYTGYLSMLSQNPLTLPLLPLTSRSDEGGGKGAALTLFEPSAEAVLEAIMPEYLSGLLYGAICESYTSELAARRTAMDSATKNAEEMIEDLSLKYNRARQSAITQEITEIIGGSG
ncbi:MAG: ATP synthase F1 subunit gamma [Clostridia bacterium]|nr:ATP synthase F1 subunit gamma [Clostridia bacterium]